MSSSSSSEYPSPSTLTDCPRRTVPLITRPNALNSCASEVWKSLVTCTTVGPCESHFIIESARSAFKGPVYDPRTLSHQQKQTNKVKALTFSSALSTGEGMNSAIISTNPTDGPKNASSTTFSKGLTSILYAAGFKVILRSASVSLSVAESSLNTCRSQLRSWACLHRPECTACTRVRG